MTTGAAACLWLWLTGLSSTHPQQDQIDRLVGHTVEVSQDAFRILDVAGEGSPLVGCVQREGDTLQLVTEAGRYPLSGPLAIPRIAGPNYKVWIVGEQRTDGQLWVRRIGILAGPADAGCASMPSPNSAPESSAPKA